MRAKFALVLLVAGLAAACTRQDAPYMDVIGGGFIFNYRLAIAFAGVVVVPLRPMPDKSEIEVSIENPAGGAPIVDERAGKGDQSRSTYPHWKGQASLKWDNGPWTALWRGRYIGETTDVVNAVKDAKTDAVFYNDLEGGYQFDKYDTAVSIGVSNVFDKAPPASYANAPINYDIYTYDARGRYGYVRVSAKF